MSRKFENHHRTTKKNDARGTRIEQSCNSTAVFLHKTVLLLWSHSLAHTCFLRCSVLHAQVSVCAKAVFLSICKVKATGALFYLALVFYKLHSGCSCGAHPHQLSMDLLGKLLREMADDLNLISVCVVEALSHSAHSGVQCPRLWYQWLS